MKFLATKFYPVDYDRRLIYADPANRERDCSVERGYRGRGTIGIKGARLNTYPCYLKFEVVNANPL